MIDTLYIHAGSHKTGTSSIQKFLRSNQVELREYDVHFVEPKGRLKTTIDLSGYGSHMPLDLALLRELDDSGVVISRENFSWIDELEVLESFRDDLLSIASNIKIIFYLRRQDSLAISHKQEGTKWLDGSIAYGHDLSALPKNLSAVAYSYLDYESKLNMWANVFGQENLIIRVFEVENLVDGDVVCDFCQILGINPDEYELPNRVNKSFNRTSQLFLHQSRSQFKDLTPEKKLLVQAVRQVDKNMDGEGILLPSRQQAMDFYQQFRASNCRLNTKFNLSSKEAIFNDDFSNYPQTIDEQGLSEKQLHQMYSKVFSHLTLKKRSDIKLSRKIRKMALALPENCRAQSAKLLKVALRLAPKKGSLAEKLTNELSGYIE